MQEAGDLSRELRKSAMEDLLDEMFQTDVPTQDDNADVLTTIKREVDLYMAQLPTSLSSDPLVWWRDNATRFPYVATLARIYLGVPATSVPSERVFSTAGDIVTAQRSRLAGDHIDQLIFLKKNLDYVLRSCHLPDV